MSLISRSALLSIVMLGFLLVSCAKDSPNTNGNTPETRISTSNNQEEEPKAEPHKVTTSNKEEEPTTQPDKASTSCSKEEEPTTQPEQVSRTIIVIETSMGTITVELFEDKAPVTIENFLKYTDEKFYDDTIFHRVIDGFMIQGGGFTMLMEQKPTHDPIKNEAQSDVGNLRGTLAMARTGIVDSATAQFFINPKDNHHLNHKDDTARGFGYCVFGKVTEGMYVVDKIAAVKTTTVGTYQDVPAKPVIIKSIRRAE